ncbi:MAG: hypothetical protein C4520_18650 [Candidatus Abyssobacteria bacterium SURF_5]|uniref:Uncharacterized protein n=1 Tax=Abyssobacteria bacterium (strain SURF_5) TaxID=2093360 RepID=A0A3A4N8E6_ABYX5|nr:MAG: hypothetical protein C4520_18650 [Candidatus Abyssubacteria bacterium SURF_5]
MNRKGAEDAEAAKEASSNSMFFSANSAPLRLRKTRKVVFAPFSSLLIPSRILSFQNGLTVRTYSEKTFEEDFTLISLMRHFSKEPKPFPLDRIVQL